MLEKCLPHITNIEKVKQIVGKHPKETKLILIAIDKDEDALQWVDSDLKNSDSADITFLINAVRKSLKGIKYIDRTETVKAIILKVPDCLKYAKDEIKNDSDVLKNLPDNLLKYANNDKEKNH